MIQIKTTLAHIFQQTAMQRAESVFIHHRGQDSTYGQIHQRSIAVANALREAGVESGDRVALLISNGPEYVASYFGALLAGGIVVALNPLTTTRELSYTLVHSEPTAVLLQSSCMDLLAPLLSRLSDLRIMIFAGQSKPTPSGIKCLELDELDGNQPVEIGRNADPDVCAQIIYTSGTTGHPKGVALSHRNLIANTRSIVDYLRLTADDSVFVVLPFYYSYGNSLLLTHVAVGGRLILAPDTVYWNRSLDIMQQQGATGISGVPSTYAMLLHRSNLAKRQFPQLRYLTCAGGALPLATVARVHEIVPHTDLFLMYGQTEAAARLSTLLPKDIEAKLGSIGKGIPGVELSVVDDHGVPVQPGETGEIVARGDNVMMGYWKDPEATGGVLRADGLHTGDLARVDEDGYIFVVGRRSDMIKSGAYRINPQEIEEVIAELDEVAEVAVVGCPDELMGESIVAFVIVSRDVGQDLEETILQHCRRGLPRHKHVRHVRFVPTLPRTSSGKVKRQELREAFSTD